MVGLSADGREQVVGLKFRGDWLGFDGIVERRATGCDAVAMDIGEVWVIGYDALLAACGRRTGALDGAARRDEPRDRARPRFADVGVLLAGRCPRRRLPALLGRIAQHPRGLRTDQITLRMTRAEIGNYLGMTLETVSRALSRLARSKVIEFAEKGRREISIPEVAALGVISSSVACCRRPRRCSTTRCVVQAALSAALGSAASVAVVASTSSGSIP